MALATKCPHCNTIFRVAADQLKLRGGIVRCGACHEVFDGNAALVEPAAKPTPVIPDVAADAAAAPPAAEPAISSYVHGEPVDLELDLADGAAAPSVSPADTPVPAVWRAAPAAGDAAPPQDTPLSEPPSPDDIARAAVARAFAAVSSPAAPKPPAVWLAAAAPPAGVSTPAPTPGRADASSPATAASSLAAAAPGAAATSDDASSPADAAPPGADSLPADSVPADSLPADSLPADSLPADALSPAAGASTVDAWPSADASPEEASASKAALGRSSGVPHPDEASLGDASNDEELPAIASSPADDGQSAAGAWLPDDAALSVEGAPPAAEETLLPWEDGPAANTPLAADAPSPAAENDTAALVLQDETGAAAPPVAAGNLDPDGRIEPSLDTAQEHIIAATLDDAHHFEDLPTDEQPTADQDNAGASGAAASANEPALGDEAWSAGSGTAGELAPADEPWSLSEPEPEPELERDDTALHAVAAVNTDAPDDGASLPDDEPPAEAPAASRRERALKRAQSRRDASGPAQPAGDETDDEEAARAQAAARMRALAGVDEAGENLDHSDLSFVKRVDRSQKYGKAVKLTMAIGIPVLLAGLALQAATTFRDTLAANYPQLKPTLAAICQPLGCKIALPAQLDALSIEQGELVTMAENTFSFSTVLRNQSKVPQAWPHIELTLNDNADKPVLRRVFAPREYLPSPAEAEKGFSPRSEQSIKLYFELKELKASGYHIAIFYP